MPLSKEAKRVYDRERYRRQQAARLAMRGPDHI
jgi:hypothetical protein